jgi:electron transfer flavoprotein beta subunit
VVDRQTRLVQTPSAFVLGPLDDLALRTAAALARPGDQITVLSAGPPAAESFAQTLAQKPVQRVVLVSHPVLAGVDYYGTARVLAAALERIGFDLVLAGDYSPDDERGAVGPATAALLDLPHLTGVERVERVATTTSDERLPQRGAILADRRAGVLAQRARVSLPAVITLTSSGPATREPNGDATGHDAAVTGEPRVELLDLAELGLAPNDLAGRGQPLTYAPTRRAPRRGGAEVLPDAEALLARLRTDGLL